MRLLPTDTSRGVTDMVLAKEKETRHMMRHVMISFMAACATGLCAAAGGSPLDEYLMFETFGDDCYADGSPLWEGECYALVWRNGDAATRVDGLFNSDGTVANPSTTKILAVFPAAVQTNYEGGVYSCARRSWALMNPMDMAMWENRGGVLSLFVFDTRRWNTESQVWELAGCDVEEKAIAAVRRYGLVTDLEDIKRGLYIGIFEWDTFVQGTSFVTSDELALFGDVTEQYSGTVNKAVGVSDELVVTFDANGGEPVPTTMRTADGPCGELPVPVRTGYVLVGWFTARTGGEKISSDTVVTDDVTYYAQWEPIRYTVVFNSNDGEGATTKQDFVYDQAQSLKENGFTRNGYVFAHWTNAVGRVFDNCEEVSNLTDVPDSKVELFAVWKCIVTFDANLGTATEISRLVKAGEKLGDLPAASRTGYASAGWFTDSTKGDAVSAETVVTEPATYYAHWTANTYTVSFVDRTGEATMDDQPMTYDQGVGLCSNQFVRVGYTFAGWTDDKDEFGVVKYGDGVVVSNLTAEANGRFELYAIWQVNSYSVKFNANGGEGEMAPQPFVYDQAQALTANGFRRDGYAFDHWTNAAAQAFDDREVVSNLTGEQDAEVELFAVWRTGDNVVTFDACGGEASKAKCAVKTLQPVGELPTAERTGYAFVGWFTAAVGGTEVTAETVITADTTYYAHWTPTVYAITYNLGGGVNAAANPTSYTVETSDIKLAAPTRKGHLFAGWMPTDLIPMGSTGAKAFTATWKATLFDEPTAGAINPKGATYNGFLGCDEALGGTFTLVVKKPKKNQTVADATLTRVDLVTGKKVKMSGRVDTVTGLGAGDLAGLVLNEKGVGGTVQINHVNVQAQGAVDAVKAKDNDALGVMKGFNKSIYGLVFENAAGEVAYLSAAFSMKGKVKVAGSYRGAKISGSAQMSVGDELCAVPFAWSKKGVEVSFVLWFDKAGLLFDVTGLGTGVIVRAAGSAEVWAPNYVFALDEEVVRASVPDAIDETFLPIDISFNGKKFDSGKAAKVSCKKGELKVDRSKGDNVTGLKLTYSKGTLKGSFTVYAVTPAGKLVKNKFTVAGVMVDGEIHAAGTNKNLKPIPLTLTK